MADDQNQADNEGQKKKSLKTIITVGGVLVLEAALIIGAMQLVGGEPQVATAGDAMDGTELAADEKIVEIQVLDAKLANAKVGVTYLYDTDIYVQVKTKHSPRVSDELEQFYNEIKASINAIWRTSEPHHFQEPRLETLTRKVYAMLNERFGTDAESGEAILVKCVIVMGTGFRVDS